MDYDSIYISNKYLRKHNCNMIPYIIKELLEQFCNYCASMSGWDTLYWVALPDIEDDIRDVSIDGVYSKYNYPLENTFFVCRVPYAKGKMIIHNNMSTLIRSSVIRAKTSFCLVIPAERTIAIVSFVGVNAPPHDSTKLSDIDFDK